MTTHDISGWIAALFVVAAERGGAMTAGHDISGAVVVGGMVRRRCECGFVASGRSQATVLLDAQEHVAYHWLKREAEAFAAEANADLAAKGLIKGAA